MTSVSPLLQKILEDIFLYFWRSLITQKMFIDLLKGFSGFKFNLIHGFDEAIVLQLFLFCGPTNAHSFNFASVIFRNMAITYVKLSELFLANIFTHSKVFELFLSSIFTYSKLTEHFLANIFKYCPMSPRFMWTVGRRRFSSFDLLLTLEISSSFDYCWGDYDSMLWLVVAQLSQIHKKQHHLTNLDYIPINFPITF